MGYKTIGELYEANEKFRGNLKEVVGNLTDEQANAFPVGEKWSISNIVEHLAMVDFGMTRICAKLLAGAREKGETSGGEAHITETFLQKTAGARDTKVDAPETVVPSGNQSIAESLAKMDENLKTLNELRPLFETVGCEGFTFPHPAFGPMNSNEWLLLLGAHEARHTAQIQRLLEKI